MGSGKVSDWLEDDAERPETADEGPDRGQGGAGSGTPVRDRPSVLMYLPQDLVERLELVSAELNLMSRRQRGRAVEKNRELYPALLRVALENLDTVRRELGLEDGVEES